jgi:5-formyltetrahydrofolate cyclo-ligase
MIRVMSPPERVRRPAAAVPATATDTDAAKATLRAEMRRVRLAIPAGERTRRGHIIAASLWSLAEMQSPDVVLSYSSFGAEVPTDDLNASLQEAGVRVLLPVLDAGTMLVVEHPKDGRLVETTYGPREPLLRSPAQTSMIDVAIVPGLAFARGGGRLGYGKGYYDRFLPQLPARAVLIGVAFSEQVVAAVPLGDGDVGLDLVVTEREVICCHEGDTPQVQ